MRTHITMTAFLLCTTVSVLGARAPWSLHSFFFRKKKERSKEEKPPPRSLRPETLAGHYPPRNSLAALAQTSAPANATGQCFSLRAPAFVPTGGEAAPVLFCVAHFSNAHPLCFRALSWGCGPTSRRESPRRFLCRSSSRRATNAAGGAAPNRAEPALGTFRPRDV